MEAKILQEQKRMEFAEKLEKAMKDDNSEAVAKAFSEFFSEIEKSIIKEAKETDLEREDAAVLAARGIRVLSNEEKAYFKSFIEAAKKPSSEVEKALTDLTAALPESEFNAIFEDMQQAHPLLEIVNFTDTAALTKFILETSSVQKAVWGELNTVLAQELTGKIKLVELTLGKLTAFMFMSNDMLDLGPAWVEKYVRTCLSEALYLGCENGIINGRGVKGEPIGMIRDIHEGVSFSSSDGYPEKEATAITSFAPAEYGKILAKIAADEQGKARSFSEVALIVNPVDYFALVMPSTTFMSAYGTYVANQFPFQTKVVRSSEVAKGKAIVGIGKKYFYGMGSGNGGKIEADTSVKFLEDLKTFKIKAYATGRAYDNNCFQLLDISGLLPAKIPVDTGAAAEPAG